MYYYLKDLEVIFPLWLEVFVVKFGQGLCLPGTIINISHHVNN